MKIYEDEKTIAHLLENGSSHASAILDIVTMDRTKAMSLMDKWDKEHKAKYLSDDLMFVPALLVSTNWNRNDDVFSPAEVWAARNSPCYKPANLNHEGSEETENKIIGVIESCRPLNKDLEYFYPEYDENDQPQLPDLYHLVIGMVIWEKYFPKAAEQIKEQANKGELFVSMEALFPDFGYALRKADDPNGVIELLPRVSATAWLTKSLRVYKGTGEVDIEGQKYKVGRWLRNITFSGVGFVSNPGNPSSIIFNDDIISKKDYRSAANMMMVENIDNFVKSSENSVSLNRKSVKHPFDR